MATLLTLLLLTLPPTPPAATAPPTATSSVAAPVAGLLPVDDRFLLRTGLLSLPPTATEALADGTWAMTATVHRANSFAKSPDVLAVLESRPSRIPTRDVHRLRTKRQSPGPTRFLVDGELSELELNVRRGLGRGFELGIDLRLLEAGGGAYDSAIEGFHETFGFGQAGREGLLRDDYGIYLETEEAVIEAAARPSGLADLRLALHWSSPTPAGAWDVAVRGMVELPTGDRDALFSNGSLDLGAQLLASRRLGRGRLHLAAAAVMVGAWDDMGLDRQLLLAGTAGYERPLRQRSSFLVQLHAGQSPFSDLQLAGLGEDVFLVTLGLKRRLRSGTEVFFALTENALHYENSADIALHLGLTTGLASVRSGRGARLAAR